MIFDLPKEVLLKEDCLTRSNNRTETLVCIKVHRQLASFLEKKLFSKLFLRQSPSARLNDTLTLSCIYPF